jgi:hypothetical protein
MTASRSTVDPVRRPFVLPRRNMRPTLLSSRSRLFSGVALVSALVWAGALQAQAASTSSLSGQCQDRVRQRFSVPSMARFTTGRSNAPGDGTIQIRGSVVGMTGSGGYRQYDYECRMLRRGGTWVADPVTLTRSGQSEGSSDTGERTNPSSSRACGDSCADSAKGRYR